LVRTIAPLLGLGVEVGIGDQLDADRFRSLAEPFAALALHLLLDTRQAAEVHHRGGNDAGVEQGHGDGAGPQRAFPALGPGADPMIGIEHADQRRRLGGGGVGGLRWDRSWRRLGRGGFRRQLLRHGSNIGHHGSRIGSSNDEGV
jgi:hypothetical protein